MAARLGGLCRMRLRNRRSGGVALVGDRKARRSHERRGSVVALTSSRSAASRSASLATCARNCAFSSSSTLADCWLWVNRRRVDVSSDWQRSSSESLGGALCYVTRARPFVRHRQR